MSDAVTALIPHTRSDSGGEDLAKAIAEHAPDVEVILAETEAETEAGFANADVLLTMWFDDEWYPHLETIDWVQALVAGVDHFDADRLAEAGVVLTNASGVHARPIAEQVLGYLLVFERNLLQAMHNQHRGEWDRFRAGELADRTVGVVGLGAIGGQVADFCRALDVEVIGSRRHPSKDPDIADEVFRADQVDLVAEQSDYLVIACPLTEETRHLIDEDILETLGPDGVLVNIARGEVVDETALVDALVEDGIGGAALDVFEEEPLPASSPLWELENVLITPHMAGSTPHYYERCAAIFAENLQAYRAGDTETMPTRIT